MKSSEGRRREKSHVGEEEKWITRQRLKKLYLFIKQDASEAPREFWCYANANSDCHREVYISYDLIHA